MKTRQILLGKVAIGGGAPVSIQSMCNTNTGDAQSSLAQIERLAAAGCDIVRLAVPREDTLAGFAEICRKSPLPVVADIHFDWRMAMAALDTADAIRINPGNIRDEAHLEAIARKAAELNRVVRIGVNMGSLSPEAEGQFGRNAQAMVHSALQYCRQFEEWGCHSLKVSLKASSLSTTVEAARLFAAQSDIPQHIGVTEAGLPGDGVIKSAIGIGALLLDGIGDTLRVSLTADPVEEVVAARKILRILGIRNDRPEFVSCPTCGRTRINLAALAQAVSDEVEKIYAAGNRLTCRKIAVMGCEVNGPGEAADADIGIAGGKGCGLIFSHGKALRTVPEESLLQEFLKELAPFVVKND